MNKDNFEHKRKMGINRLSRSEKYLERKDEQPIKKMNSEKTESRQLENKEQITQNQQVPDQQFDKNQTKDHSIYNELIINNNMLNEISQIQKKEFNNDSEMIFEKELKQQLNNQNNNYEFVTDLKNEQLSDQTSFHLINIDDDSLDKNTIKDIPIQIPKIIPNDFSQNSANFIVESKQILNNLEEIVIGLKSIQVVNNNEQNINDESSKQISEIIINNENCCPICSLNLSEILSLLNCEHKFCKICYKDYLEDKIKVAKVIDIPCMQEGCKQIFTEQLIFEIISPQKKEQYLHFKRKIEIESDPNKKWCPTPGCKNYVEKDLSSTIVKCECGASVCFKCGLIAHYGLQCDQVIDENLVRAIKQYNIKYCPNCKSHVEKNAGCNHMTCIVCRHQFCWICLQKYYEYHYRYWSIRGCAIWSNGRFKHKVIQNPDFMRRIYFIPRLFLLTLRIPLLILKVTLNAAGKSISKPFVKMNKKCCRLRRPRSCCLRVIFYFFFEIFILLVVILYFPFYFFYRLGKEIRWISIKGLAY